MGSPAIDVVLVPWLKSEPLDLWTSILEQNSMQTKVLQDNPKARVWVHDWTAPSSEDFSASDLNAAAVDLLTRIESQTLVEHDMHPSAVHGSSLDYDQICSRSLLFVAHSLGGVIVKQALLLARSRSNMASIAWRTFGIIFLKSPHKDPLFNSMNDDKLLVTGSSAFNYSPGPSNEVSEKFQQIASLYSIAYFCNESCRTEYPAVTIHGNCLWATMSQAHTFKIAEHHYLVPKSLNSNILSQKVQQSIECMSHAAVQRQKRLITNVEDQSILGIMQLQKRLPKTFSWFFESESFQNWIHTSGPNTLWICGNAGAGKSVLASSIVEQVKSAQTSEEKLFYFLRKDTVLQSSAAELLENLVSQFMMESQPLVPNHILKALLSIVESSSGWISQDQFRRHMRNILKSVDIASRLILVLDGLDDHHWIPTILCEELQVANKLRHNDQAHKCVISSRFSCPADFSRKSITVVDMNKEAGIRNDIFWYAKTQLASIFCNLDRDDLAHLATLISSRAENILLWAVLAIERLHVDATAKELREEILSLPFGLDNIYRSIMQKIPSGVSGRGTEIIQFIAAATRPLKLSELQEAFSSSSKSCDGHRQVEKPDRKHVSWNGGPWNSEADLLKSCGGLVTITKDGYVNLVHASVRDFLSKPNMADTTNDFLLEAHDLVARKCLHTLCSSNPSRLLSICGRCRMKDESCGTTSLQDYAAANWWFHYNIAEPHSRTLAGSLQRSLNIACQDACERLSIPQASRYNDLLYTTLNFCAYYGANSLMQMHLESGIVPCSNECEQCMTPLSIAAWRGSDDVVATLLQQSSSHYTNQCPGVTLLSCAIASGNPKIVRMVLENGKETDANSSKVEVSMVFAAVSLGDLETVKLLLEYNTGLQSEAASPEIVPATGLTALHIAANYGHLSILSYLIDGEIDDSVECMTPRPPWDCIYFQSWSEDLLLELSGNEQYVWELEERLAAEREITYWSQQFPACVDLDTQDHKGQTPLHLAARNGHNDVLQYLIMRGAAYNVYDRRFRTPLQLAAENGQLRTVHHLMAVGAAIYPTNESFGSFVERIYSYGHEAVANFLMFESYITDLTGKGCRWRMLDHTTKGGRSPVGDALSKKRSRGKKYHLSTVAVLPQRMDTK